MLKENKKKYIGYATYLNVRVSIVIESDDINFLLKSVEELQCNIPKLFNCSFVIEPNSRVCSVEGFNSYDDFYEHQLKRYPLF